MAKTYKLQVKELRNELNSVKADIDHCVGIIKDRDKEASFMKKEIEIFNNKISSMKEAGVEKSNLIAKLAEEGLIEAYDDIGNHDTASMVRLIGRLEGHLRGIINTVGCEHRVKRDEGLDRPNFILNRVRDHGSVSYKNKYELRTSCRD